METCVVWQDPSAGPRASFQPDACAGVRDPFCTRKRWGQEVTQRRRSERRHPESTKIELLTPVGREAFYLGDRLSIVPASLFIRIILLFLEPGPGAYVGAEFYHQFLLSIKTQAQVPAPPPTCWVALRHDSPSQSPGDLTGSRLLFPRSLVLALRQRRARESALKVSLVHAVVGGPATTPWADTRTYTQTNVVHQNQRSQEEMQRRGLGTQTLELNRP